MPIDFVLNYSTERIKGKPLEPYLLSLGVGVEEIAELSKDSIRDSVERAIKKALFELMERTENVNSNVVLNARIDYKIVEARGRTFVIAVAYGTSAVMRDV